MDWILSLLRSANDTIVPVTPALNNDYCETCPTLEMMYRALHDPQDDIYELLQTNYPPDTALIRILKQRVFVAQLELREYLRAEGQRYSIKYYIQSVSSTQPTIKRLCQTIKAHESIFSAFRRLPTEIILQVMKATIEYELDNQTSRMVAPSWDVRKGLWIFGWICRPWRAIALSDPSLWVNIHISRLEKYPIPNLQSYIERSGEQPLRVFIDLEWNSRWRMNLHTFLRPLLLTSYRWVSLEIHIGPETSEFLVSNKQQLILSQLHTLHIRMHCECLSIEDASWAIRSFRNLPSLRKFDFADSFAHILDFRKSFNYPPITHLSFYFPVYLNDDPEFLQQYPDLWLLCLGGWINSAKSICLPSVQRLQLENLSRFSTNIALPSLEVVFFNGKYFGKYHLATLRHLLRSSQVRVKRLAIPFTWRDEEIWNDHISWNNIMSLLDSDGSDLQSLHIFLNLDGNKDKWGSFISRFLSSFLREGYLKKLSLPNLAEFRLVLDGTTPGHFEWSHLDTLLEVISIYSQGEAYASGRKASPFKRFLLQCTDFIAIQYYKQQEEWIISTRACGVDFTTNRTVERRRSWEVESL